MEDTHPLGLRGSFMHFTNSDSLGPGALPSRCAWLLEQNRLELRPGMTFTIEPIFTEGDQDTEVWPDGWTVVTKDRGRAAQFEHVVLITESGHEVLTVQELPPASSTSA